MKYILQNQELFTLYRSDGTEIIELTALGDSSLATESYVNTELLKKVDSIIVTFTYTNYQDIDFNAESFTLTPNKTLVEITDALVNNKLVTATVILYPEILEFTGELKLIQNSTSNIIYGNFLTTDYKSEYILLWTSDGCQFKYKFFNGIKKLSVNESDLTVAGANQANLPNSSYSTEILGEVIYYDISTPLNLQIVEYKCTETNVHYHLTFINTDCIGISIRVGDIWSNSRTSDSIFISFTVPTNNFNIYLPNNSLINDNVLLLNIPQGTYIELEYNYSRNFWIVSRTNTPYVSDVSYVHTDNNYTTEEKTLLSNITIEDISSWNHKQDKLTFDSIPTLNSSNPVTSNGIKTELDKKIESINLEEYCPTLLQELMVGLLTGSPVALTQTALNEYNSLENITGQFCIAPTLFGPTLLQMGYFNDQDDPQSQNNTYYSRTYFSVLPILGHSGTKNLSDKLSLYKPLIYIQHSFYVGENSTTINNDYELILESQYLQEKLGFDNYPILDSDNMLTSGSIYNALQLKQNNLVSGTNIKTINNESLLGNGNIETVKIYDISSNIYSNDSTVKKAACEELYEAINNGCICKLFDTYYATKQIVSLTSKSKTINLSFEGSYTESPGLLIQYSLNAFYDLSEDTWWVRDDEKSMGIYNICESFLRISGSVDNNTGIISGSIYYDTISPYSVNKIILHLNNSTGITSNSVLQITANLNNTTYEGPIYVMQNGQYVKLSADMFTGQIDIPLVWSAATASSTTGTWYSFMSFDSNTTTLLSYITGGNYNSTNKKIYLTHDSSVISEIDATAFIKDGMINDVSIIDSSMVITFNTDAGKEDITLNMHQIFDPSIYYTKNEIDTNFVVNASIQNINKVPYVSETPAANVTIEPYKMYDFGTVSTTMNIAFDTTKEVSGYTKEYIIRLTAESGCSVVLPNTVLYANRNIPNYTAGHIYEITIVNNCAVVAEFY